VAEGALEGAKGKAEHPKEHCPSTKVATTSGIADKSPVRLPNRLCWKTLKSALMPGLHKQQCLNCILLNSMFSNSNFLNSIFLKSIVEGSPAVKSSLNARKRIAEAAFVTSGCLQYILAVFYL